MKLFNYKSHSRFSESPKTFGKSILMGMLLLLSFSISAQVATLDSRKVMASMPIFAKLDTMVLEEQQKYVQEYAKKRYQTQVILGLADSLYKVKPTDPKTMEIVEKANKQSEDLQAYEKMANAKMTDYKSVLFQPYYDRVNAAIKSVAQRLKYSQVMDIQQVAFVYIDPLKDITAEVIKQLIIK